MIDLMNNLLEIWKCECCNYSNPNSFEDCSYCGLPKAHTFEQLQKYKEMLPQIKSTHSRGSLGQFLIRSFGYMFYAAPALMGMLIILVLSAFPQTKDKVPILMPFIMVSVIIIGGYYYLKN